MGRRAGRAAGPQEPGPLEEAGTACLAGAGGGGKRGCQKRAEGEVPAERDAPRGRERRAEIPWLLPFLCLPVFLPMPHISENDLNSAREFGKYIFLRIQTRAKKDEECTDLRAKQANEWHSPIFLLLSSIPTTYSIFNYHCLPGPAGYGPRLLFNLISCHCPHIFSAVPTPAPCCCSSGPSPPSNLPPFISVQHV